MVPRRSLKRLTLITLIMFMDYHGIVLNIICVPWWAELLIDDPLSSCKVFINPGINPWCRYCPSILDTGYPPAEPAIYDCESQQAAGRYTLTITPELRNFML